MIPAHGISRRSRAAAGQSSNGQVALSLIRGSPARRAVMLCDPPVTVLPDESPGHAIGTGLVAIGEIDVAGCECDVRSDLPDQRNRIGLHTDVGWAPAEIGADGITALLQFIDRTEQDGILGIEFHVSVEVMAIEGFHPLSVQTFNGSRCTHNTLIKTPRDHSAASGRLARAI